MEKQKYIWEISNCKELLVPSFSKFPICPLLVLLIKKRQIFLCFFSWKTLNNAFYMIIAVGMSNFYLKTRQLCSYNILNINVICLKRDWRHNLEIFLWCNTNHRHLLIIIFSFDWNMKFINVFMQFIILNNFPDNFSPW